MRYFFLLEAVCAEFNGKEEKPGSFFPRLQICFHLPHLDFIPFYPSSLRSQRERGREEVARELLGRHSQVLKDGTQGVKKTWGGSSDLAHLVAPLPDTKLDGTSMIMQGSFSQKMAPGSHGRAAMCWVRGVMLYECLAAPFEKKILFCLL